MSTVREPARGVITLLVAATLLAAAGCGEGETATPGEPPTPRFAEDGTIAVDDFNTFLAGAEEPWERDAEAVAIRFAHPVTQEAEIVGATVAPGDDGGRVAVVTVTGLADDSVTARRTSVALVRDGDTWKLVSATWSQRCAPDRGHDGWSTEPCV